MRLHHQVLIFAGAALTLFACGTEDDAPAPPQGDRVIVQLKPSGTSLASGVVATQGDWKTGAKLALREEFPSLHEVTPLSELPMMIVTGVSLEALLASPHVERAWADARYQASDTASFAYIGQPAALDGGASGSGSSVAVLDTGVDYTRAAFGSCTAAGAPGCAVAYAQDFAADDGQLDDVGHGTNVSGIIVGEAPGVKVLGLDVFTTGGYALSSDIISAINWVIANQATYSIVAMNLSLGGGSSSTTCPTDVFALPVQQARAAGVLAAIASGNDAKKSSLSSPACTPDAISVGAVYDQSFGGQAYSVCTDSTTATGQTTCFSNSTAFLSLWAPGSQITAAGITMSGTSQATPHVAGALALLAHKYPTDSADTRASRLLAGAPTVKDAANGLTRPRLSLGSALGGCNVTLNTYAPSFGYAASTASLVITTPTGCAWSMTGLPTWVTASATSGTGGKTVTLSAPLNTGAARVARFQVAGAMVQASQAADTTPPTGTATAPKTTRSLTVTLTLSATDPSGVNGMCLSTTSSCSSFVTYATSKAVSLSAPDGLKTVYVWYRDGRGNVTANPLSVTTTLDTTAPTDGTLSGAVLSSSSVKVSWSGYSDATTGIASYKLVQSTTSSDPAASCTGTAVYSGSATSATVSMAAHTTRHFRVCASDVAGNVSAGALLAFTSP